MATHGEQTLIIDDQSDFRIESETLPIAGTNKQISKFTQALATWVASDKVASWPYSNI